MLTQKQHRHTQEASGNFTMGNMLRLVSGMHMLMICSSNNNNRALMARGLLDQEEDAAWQL
jgi:hypothetical protein